MKPISDENYYFSYEYYDESTDVAYQNLHKDKVFAIRKWLPYSHPNKNYYDALPLDKVIEHLLSEQEALETAIEYAHEMQDAGYNAISGKEYAAHLKRLSSEEIEFKKQKQAAKDKAEKLREAACALNKYKRLIQEINS